MADLPKDLNQLARWAVQQPWWEWRPRMRRDDGWTFIGLDASNGEEHGFVGPADCGIPGPSWSWPCHLREANAAPDLTDPATRGALLGLLRERAGDDDLFACRQYGTGLPSWWVVCECDEEDHYVLSGGPTEAHAIIAALVRVSALEKRLRLP